MASQYSFDFIETVPFCNTQIELDYNSSSAVGSVQNICIKLVPKIKLQMV